MSGFADSIVGGVGTLIREFIKSPNYVPDISGWSINQDGSAEFNNATFRGTVIIDSTTEALLVYSGIPALGNLILAICAHAGVDPYGNAFNGGLSISTGELGGEYLTFYDSGIQQSIGGIVGGPYASPNPGVFFQDQRGNVLIGAMNNPNPALNTPYLQLWDAINNFALKLGTLTSGIGLQVGAGIPGKYYSEIVSLDNGQSIANDVGVTLTNLVAQYLASDYGSGFDLTTGAWTPPVDSFYDFSISILLSTWVANSNLLLGIEHNGGLFAQFDTTERFGTAVLSVNNIYCTTDASYTFITRQNSGASRAISSTTGPPYPAGRSWISIGRRL